MTDDVREVQHTSTHPKHLGLNSLSAFYFTKTKNILIIISLKERKY